MQEQHFIRYAAFIKDACNCARFVTDTLINAVTDKRIRKRLVRSTWFTPSTVGNVVIANSEDHVYEVTEEGIISIFNSSVRTENIRNFLDRLSTHEPSFIGTLQPREVEVRHEHAQWLDGIAAGAWFELHQTNNVSEYRFRRISPYGNIDVHALYKVDDTSFNYHLAYRFVHYSNCKFYHVEQGEKIFRFEFLETIS